MEIHKYEKIWFAAALVLVVLFISSVAYGAVGAGIQMVDDEGGEINPNEIGDHPTFEGYQDVAGTEASVTQVNESHYEAQIQANHPNFFPGEITVPEGSTVTFYITAGDVIHSYDIVGTNVNTMVIPGQIAELTAEFEEPNEYGVVCSEYCGELHHEMEGMVNVVSEDEWEENYTDDLITIDERGGDN